jgi:hypothetical protein
MLDTADVWLSSLSYRRAAPSAVVRGGVAGRDRTAAHRRDAAAHRLEQEPGRQILGIERSTLDRKIKLYDLKR